MTPDEFRRHGHRVVDWVASYLERVESLPVRSQVAPGAIRARLPARPPEHGEPFADILRDVDEILLPGITHWQSPNFFAYFPSSASEPSMLGELVAAGLGVQGMLWSTSPACTELEAHVLDWLVDLLALPDRFSSRGPGGGVIQDTASSATLCALLAARERNRSRPQAVAYASAEAHSSVEKGARIAGYEALRPIEVDAAFAMRPEALDAAIERDLAAGLRPAFVCATVGTTSSTALDPLRPVGETAQRHDLWLHVDAAMAGTAAVCPEHRDMHDGLELADSFVFNPHKWMLTNVDCSCLFVADRSALIDALSVKPEYLRNPASQSGDVIDYRDWQVSLGRRFRALKLWFVIRHYGIEGLRAHVRDTVAMARRFADRMAADSRFELAAPVPLGLVCFRHVGGDGPTLRLLDGLDATGRAYLTQTRLAGRLVARLALGGRRTESRHVEAVWDLIDELAEPA